MVLILQYHDRQGMLRSFWIRRHEAVTVGSGRQSDQVVLGDAGIDKCHFHISHQEEQWVLESVTDRPLSVNGEYVRLRILQERDTIQAGGTIFIVQSLPLTTTSKTNAECDDRNEIQTTDRQIANWFTTQAGQSRAHSRLQGGIDEYYAEMVEGDVLHIFREFSSVGSTSMLWNRKAMGDAQASLIGWTVVREDLFLHAPPEIRQEHTLAIGSLDWNQCNVDHLLPILRSDTAILVFHAGSTDQWTKSKQTIWGWFARPSMLQFHLRNGSPMLLELLVADGDMLAFLDASSKRQLFIYARKQATESHPIMKYWIGG
jgi:pSer/pThr/pTyr-binding forkhead associated (FHA) protein